MYRITIIDRVNNCFVMIDVINWYRNESEFRYRIPRSTLAGYPHDYVSVPNRDVRNVVPLF